MDLRRRTDTKVFCNTVSVSEYEQEAQVFTAQEVRRLLSDVKANPELAARCKHFKVDDKVDDVQESSSTGRIPVRTAAEVFLLVCCLILLTGLSRFVYVRYASDIWTAARYGQTARVLSQTLVHPCISTNAQGSDSTTAVSDVESIDCRITNELGNTPLHEAVRYNWDETAAALLQSGYSVSTTNHLSKNALHESSSVKMTELLLSAVKEKQAVHVVEKRSALGQTPLSEARSAKQAEILINFWLKTGGDDLFFLVSALSSHLAESASLRGKEALEHIYICQLILDTLFKRGANADVVLMEEELRKVAFIQSRDLRVELLPSVLQLIAAKPGNTQSLYTLLQEVLKRDDISSLQTIVSVPDAAKAVCTSDALKRTLWSSVESRQACNILKSIKASNCISMDDLEHLWVRARPNVALKNVDLLLCVAEAHKADNQTLFETLPISARHEILDKLPQNVAPTDNHLAVLYEPSISQVRSIHFSEKQKKLQKMEFALSPAESVLITGTNMWTNTKQLHITTRSDYGNVRGYALLNSQSIRGPLQTNNWLGWYPSWTAPVPVGSSAGVVLTCANAYLSCHIIIEASVDEETGLDNRNTPMAETKFGPNLFAHARLASLIWLPLSTILPQSLKYMPLIASFFGFYAAGLTYAAFWCMYTGCSLFAMAVASVVSGRKLWK